jgi:hypothetical protein
VLPVGSVVTIEFGRTHEDVGVTANKTCRQI